MSFIGSIASAFGSFTAASAYGKEASLYGEDVQLAKESNQIQQVAANRQITQQMGQGRASYGAAGLKLGGSALSVLRSAVAQGSQQKAMISINGQLQENNFSAQQIGAQEQETAATISGVSSSMSAASDLMGMG